MPYALLGLLLAVLYYHITTKLIIDWVSIPDYSHGPLVPFFSLYLLWDKRSVLRSIPLEPSWKGLYLILPGLAVLILGVYGADLFLSRTSLSPSLLAGLLWTFAGSFYVAGTPFSPSGFAPRRSPSCHRFQPQITPFPFSYLLRTRHWNSQSHWRACHFTKMATLLPFRS